MTYSPIKLIETRKNTKLYASGTSKTESEEEGQNLKTDRFLKNPPVFLKPKQTQRNPKNPI